MGRERRPSLPFFPLPMVPCALYFALFSASLEPKEASAEEREDRPLKAQIRLLSTCHQNTLIYLFVLKGCFSQNDFDRHEQDINPFAPADFAEKRVVKLVEWFSGHCLAM